MASMGFQPSNRPPIADTGMKGFLKWYQREQPYDYPRVARAAWKNAPEVFSDYVQSRATIIRQRAGAAANYARTRDLSFSGLGDTFDITNTDPTYVVPYAPDMSLQPTNVATDDTTLNQTVPPTNVSVSDMANAGAGTSTPTTTWLASLVSAVGSAFTSAQQANTAQAITRLQLQRAQAGLAPLNIGMSANGIPVVGSGGFASLFSGNGLLVLGAAAAAYFIFGRRRSRA